MEGLERPVVGYARDKRVIEDWARITIERYAPGHPEARVEVFEQVQTKVGTVRAAGAAAK